MANIPVNSTALTIIDGSSTTGSFAGFSVLTDSANFAALKDANGNLLSNITFETGFVPMFITSASLSTGTIFIYGTEISVPTPTPGPSYLLNSYLTNTAYGWSIPFQVKDIATNAIRIRRSNDNAETDIGFVNGVLDTTSITSFVGANSAFITKIYEQNGSGYDFTQTTAAYQPQIVTASVIYTLNGKPCARCFPSDGGTNIKFMTVPNTTSSFKWLHDGTTTSSMFNTYGLAPDPINTPNYVPFSTVYGVSVPNLVGVNVVSTLEYNTYSTSIRTLGSSTSSSVASVSMTPGILADSSSVYISYLDPGNATRASRLILYFNSSSAVSGSTSPGTASLSASVRDLTIIDAGTTGGFPISYWQELIIFKSQPTVNTIRTEINSRYNIY